MEIGNWLELAGASLTEVATGMLGLEAGESRPAGETPEGLYGAYIPILAEDATVQLGVMASLEGCSGVARALLGMEPDEEMDEDDMFDSIGEVVNIVAGSVKTTLAAKNLAAQLGLPLAVEGKVHTTESTPKASLCMAIDGHDVWLIVSGNPRKAGS